MNRFFNELKRRNVVRVAIAYVVVSWVLLQFVDVVAPLLGLPEVFQKGVLLLLVLGLPIALILSWAYELTADGVKKTEEVDQSTSLTHGTGQKLNRLVIGGLVVAVGFLLLDKFYLTTEPVVEVIPEAQVVQASIAVLPFSDLSSQGDQEYFADGLSEEILNVLVGVDNLTVASRTSSFQFKNDELGLPDIAAKLGVTYVLEGSVRKAGQTIRVTGQLIEAGTDRHLWSDTFDRELTTENLFAIQDEIATAIVEALRLELGVPEDGMVMDSVGVATENLSAYDKFLRGRDMFHGRNKLSDISGSITLFEKAIEEDSDFALGWQWLGAAYSVASGWGLHKSVPRDYPVLAKTASERALELDPNLAFAHGVRGFSAIIEPGGDYLFAMQQMERGLELDPNNVTMVHWYGIVLREMGFVKASLEYFAMCEILDPAFANCYEHRARTSMFLSDYRTALEEWNRFPKEFVRVASFEIFDAYTIAKMGQAYAARLVLSESFRDQPDFPVTSWVTVVQKNKDRNSPEARRVARWLDEADKHKILVGSSQGADLLMFLYLSIGAYDKVDTTAISLGPGNVKGIWMKDFAGFQKTPQFKEVVRNMNFLPYWQARGFPPGCRAVGSDDFECGN
jgi:TolB-like protein